MKTFKVKKIPFNQENIDIYKTKQSTLPWNKSEGDDTNMLIHARYIPDITKGLFLINNVDNSLIGYISWEGKKITSLEVMSDYQGLGYGKYLLCKALKDGCNWLVVNKNNKNAIQFYLSQGFHFTRTKYGNNLRMKI